MRMGSPILPILLSFQVSRAVNARRSNLRVLGIDYGHRHIGLAISDALGLAAHGLPTLSNKSEQQVLDALRELVQARDVGHIVVGLPRNMDGSLGPQAEKVMSFAERLSALGRPVHFTDERLTTERAERVMKDAGLSRAKRRKKVDRLAATFILQLYLDTSRSRRLKAKA